MPRELPRGTQQVAGLGAVECRFLEWQGLSVFCTETGLGVEEIHMGWPTRHEEEDDAFGLGDEVGRGRYRRR